MYLTLVIHSMSCGGAEKIMALVANYWAEKGHHVTLLTMSDGPSYYELHPAINYRPLGLVGSSSNPAQAVLKNAARLWQLRRTLKASQPDAIISFMDKQNVLTILAALGLKIPVIVSEHTEPSYARLSHIWQILRKWAYPQAASVVVLTESAARYFSSGVQAKTRIIPNPVSLPNLPKRGKPNAEEKTLIAMGRLIPLKGFDLLVKAFARVAALHPEWSLTIWGEGPERPQLEGLISALGLTDQVRLPGFTARPLEQMRRADLFVLSSRYEGFPTVLWEAMACGLPVISFDCPSGPGAIIRHGLDGMLVHPEDSEALALALDWLMSNQAERERLAAHAPEVLERFSPEKIMGKWEKLLQDVTNKSVSSDLLKKPNPVQVKR